MAYCTWTNLLISTFGLKVTTALPQWIFQWMRLSECMKKTLHSFYRVLCFLCMFHSLHFYPTIHELFEVVLYLIISRIRCLLCVLHFKIHMSWYKHCPTAQILRCELWRVGCPCALGVWKPEFAQCLKKCLALWVCSLLRCLLAKADFDSPQRSVLGMPLQRFSAPEAGCSALCSLETTWSRQEGR